MTNNSFSHYFGSMVRQNIMLEACGEASHSLHGGEAKEREREEGAGVPLSKCMPAVI